MSMQKRSIFIRSNTLAITLLSCVLIFLTSCKRQESEPLATEEIKPVVETSSPAQTEPSSAAPAAEGLIPEFNALAANKLPADSEQVKQYLTKYFKDECSKDESLPFDQVCQHYPDEVDDSDPSPWPDFMLAIKENTIVSGVLFDTSQTPPSNWRCTQSEINESLRYCYDSDISNADREAWSKEWSGFFAVAD